MKLHPDDGSPVEWIEDLAYDGKKYKVVFKSGKYRDEDDGFRTYIADNKQDSVLMLSLGEALGLCSKIASALGEGPEGSGPNSVKDIDGVTNDRYVFNFQDTKGNLFDVIEFFIDVGGVKYVNEAGPQISNLPDWEPSYMDFRQITIADISVPNHTSPAVVTDFRMV